MIIDGKKIAEEILEKIAEEVKKLKPLTLAAILVGDHPGNSDSSRQPVSSKGAPRGRLEPSTGSRRFLELKKRAAEKVGIKFVQQEFPADLPQGVLTSRIKSFIQSGKYDGVLIELPLPRTFDPAAVLNAVPSEKDVDVLSESAQKNFYSGDFSILPPAVEAVKNIFERYQVNPASKKIAVFGQGLLVGKPIAFWLYQQGGQVSVIDEFTKNPEKYSQEADIIISGVGKPNLIKAEMVKPRCEAVGAPTGASEEGAVVIDFGYENLEGKMVGDVDFEKVKEKCSLITPVPGGVGPLVIAAVLSNLLKLAKRKPAKI